LNTSPIATTSGRVIDPLDRQVRDDFDRNTSPDPDSTSFPYRPTIAGS
jgi:hypothetical protein